MHSCLVRRTTTLALFVGATALLGACDDARVAEMDTGITRDSAINMMAKDAPKSASGDSMPNVYWRETYLIAGKNYEVLYFHPDGEKVKSGTDTVYTDLTPVVMIENRVVGKGWDYWDSVSTANKIPLKKREG